MPKTPKAAKKKQNTPAAARTRFLQKAAVYLQTREAEVIPDGPSGVVEDAKGQTKAAARVVPSHLASHMLAVSRKGQVQLSPEMKHSICKRCHAVLVPDSTFVERVENKSNGQKKAWADVRVVECLKCGAAKRFPIGARRQKKRAERDSIRRYEI